MSLAFDTKGVYAKMSKEFKDGVEKLDLIAKKNSAVAVEYAADFSKSFDKYVHCCSNGYISLIHQ